MYPMMELGNNAFSKNPIKELLSNSSSIIATHMQIVIPVHREGISIFFYNLVFFILQVLVTQTKCELRISLRENKQIIFL